MGRDSLERACRKGSDACVDQLIRAGAKVDEFHLWTACRWGYHGCISLLLDAGVSVNAKSHGGCTALHTAVEFLLHSHGEKWLRKDKEEHRGSNSVALLLEHGADTEIQNDDGNTIWDKADEDLPILHAALAPTWNRRAHEVRRTTVLDCQRRLPAHPLVNAIDSLADTIAAMAALSMPRPATYAPFSISIFVQTSYARNVLREGLRRSSRRLAEQGPKGVSRPRKKSKR